MKVFVCVDKNGGIMFNKRRVSQDSVLRKRIIEICEGSPLYMSEYSSKQFEDFKDNIKADDNFVSLCKKDDFCFMEDIPVPPEKIDELYLFNWNRNYPSDIKLSFNPEKEGLKKISSTDFEGSSHEKITMTVYKKEN